MMIFVNLTFKFTILKYCTQFLPQKSPRRHFSRFRFPAFVSLALRFSPFGTASINPIRFSRYYLKMFDFPMNSPTNLRDLIVYDISLWKTIDKSYKNYEKLCEVMKKEAISYDNYEYWFNRYLKESYYSAKNGR